MKSQFFHLDHGPFGVPGRAAGRSPGVQAGVRAGRPDAKAAEGSWYAPRFSLHRRGRGATGFGGTVDLVNSATHYYGDVYAVGNSSGDFIVDRFLPFSSSDYGALDTVFGSGGEDTLDFGTTSANTTDTARGVGVESDETAVVAGQTTSSTGSVAVARFLQRNTLLIASSGNTPLIAANAFSSGPVISATSDPGTSDLLPIDPTGLHKLRHRRGPRALLMG